MPSTTGTKNLPYPLGTDRLMDGDDQIRKLAQSVDNMTQTGSTSITPTVGSVNTASITFPVAYSAAPVVVCGLSGSISASIAWPMLVWPTAVGVSGFTLNFISSVATQRSLLWIAVGPVVAVS